MVTILISLAVAVVIGKQIVSLINENVLYLTNMKDIMF
jgi:hypothetical protein